MKRKRQKKKRRPYHVEYAEVITECDPDIQVGQTHWSDSPKRNHQVGWLKE